MVGACDSEMRWGCVIFRGNRACVKTGKVSWGVWIVGIEFMVFLPVFLADMPSAKVDMHIVTALAVRRDVCCELSGD